MFAFSWSKFLVKQAIYTYVYIYKNAFPNCGMWAVCEKKTIVSLVGA
jgi:hypothetical protein